MTHRVDIYHAGGRMPSLVLPSYCALKVRLNGGYIIAPDGRDFAYEPCLLRPRIGLIGDPRNPLSEPALATLKGTLYNLANNGVNLDAIVLDVEKSPLFGLNTTKLRDNIRAHFGLKAAGC